MLPVTQPLSEMLRQAEASARRLVTETHGRKTVWRVWGRGRPLVALHGGFGSWNHYLRMVPLLSRDRMLICPDIPGYGDSDLPAGDDPVRAIPAALSDGLRQVLRVTQEDGDTVDVMGFSFGTGVAGLLCKHLDEGSGGVRPRRLILLAPSALGEEMSRVSGKEKLRPGMAQAARARVHAANLALVMLAPGAEVDDLTLRMQDMNVRRTRMRGKGLSQSSALRDLLRKRPVEAIAAIWGAEDPYLSGIQDNYRRILLESYLDAALLVHPRIGHWVQHEAPKITAAFIGQFLSAAAPVTPAASTA